MIGVRVNFVSSSHADGTFAACCAVNDNGAAQADVTAYTVKGDRRHFRGDRDVRRLEGHVQARAARHHRSAEQPPPHRARPLAVLDGTGEYAQLSGEGQFTALTDETDGALTAINNGEVER